MAKNKNKNKNNKSNNNIVQQKVVADFSFEQIEKVEKFAEEEMPEEANMLTEEVLSETNEDDQKIVDIKKTGNVEKYIDFLRDKLKRLRALEAKAEEIKSANFATQKEITDAKKELEDEQKKSKKELEDLRKDLNNRQKKLEEEQLAIDNGEYTSVIQGLLTSLRNTEEEITSSTRQLVEEMGKKHMLYISTLSELTKKQGEISAQQAEVDTVRYELERERKRIEVSKVSFERRVRKEIEDDFQDKITDLEDENAMLKRKNGILDKNVKSLTDFKRELMSTFDSTNVDMMVAEQRDLRDSFKKLQKELDGCPTTVDYEEKVASIDELKNKVRDLEEKVSEERLSELRLSLHNADAYILEINTYKAKLDSAQAREKSLLRTVQDLHETISRLKDEEKVKEGAFEQARRMDNDAELQNRKLRFVTPSSLTELVEYLQRYMATVKDSEPFYYEQRTIRTFIAGLNMSLLSILQGISGTGKTSLPREIAKALVAGSDGYTDKDEAGNRNEPYRICAVQSGWRDNMDLIGFYNNFERKYKETDFFKAIYLAAQPKYKNTLFFVILDEMNLSHPEHYFADFLSMMEQNVGDRYVKINADEELLPKLIKERQIQLPPNVRFIGTANHDETTLDFAPKTYDRSNVLVMATNDANKVRTEMERFGHSGQKERLSIGYNWLLSQFRDSEELYSKYYEEFNKFLKTKELLLMLEERGIGVGNRFYKQSKKFICAYIAAGTDPIQCLAEATDHLVTSRLFRSLRNRYDLTADNLNSFLNYYTDLFKNSFGGKEPTDGIRLLKEEIFRK